MKFRFTVSVLLVLLLASEGLVWAGLNSKKAMYSGGTVAIPEGKEGTLNVQGETALLFSLDKEKNQVCIPYAAITSLEYGQKSGRRVGAAVVVNPLFLFSKKRKHYLTITYKDEVEKEQVVILELGKDIVRTTLAILKARSGKEIEFQDEEARKQMGGGK